jgi:hypothetical protein
MANCVSGRWSEDAGLAGTKLTVDAKAGASNCGLAGRGLAVIIEFQNIFLPSFSSLRSLVNRVGIVIPLPDHPDILVLEVVEEGGSRFRGIRLHEPTKSGSRSRGSRGGGDVKNGVKGCL